MRYTYPKMSMVNLRRVKGKTVSLILFQIRLYFVSVFGDLHVTLITAIDSYIRSKSSAVPIDQELSKEE